MSYRVASFRVAAVLGLVMSAVTGCTPNSAELSGVVTDNGQPVLTTNEEEPPLLLLLCEDGGSSQTISCGFPAKDGRFVAYSPEGVKSLKPGKYKIGFQYASGKPKTGKSFNPGEAELEIDLIPGDKANVTIDAAKRTISR